jgi:endonuclease YncB( thermonuclease family)
MALTLLARSANTAVIALLAAALFSTTSNVGASEIVERALVIEGDTLLIRGVSVRLAGADAPELGQTCLTADKTEWACGLDAKHVLIEKIGAGKITCDELHIDPYDRIFATCSASGEGDLSAAMVRSGYALAWGQRYLDEEDIARHAGSGMWSGSFETPWEWRAKQPDEDRKSCEDINCIYLSGYAAVR